MNRQGAQASMVWLGPVIQSEPDTLEALPGVCLCELLVIVQAENTESTKYLLISAFSYPLSLLSRLLSRLLHYLINSGTSSTIELLEYFLERLSHTYALTELD